MVDVGLTFKIVPVPANVPPQLSVYQFQVAPLPKDPPTTLSDVLPPLQMVVVPLILLGSVEGVSTLTRIDEQLLVSQVLSALT